MASWHCSILHGNDSLVISDEPILWSVASTHSVYFGHITADDTGTMPRELHAAISKYHGKHYFGHHPDEIAELISAPHDELRHHHFHLSGKPDGMGIKRLGFFPEKFHHLAERERERHGE
jgi:hypothetical protein